MGARASARVPPTSARPAPVVRQPRTSSTSRRWRKAVRHASDGLRASSHRAPESALSRGTRAPAPPPRRVLNAIALNVESAPFQRPAWPSARRAGRRPALGKPGRPQRSEDDRRFSTSEARAPRKSFASSLRRAWVCSRVCSPSPRPSPIALSACCFRRRLLPLSVRVAPSCRARRSRRSSAERLGRDRFGEAGRA